MGWLECVNYKKCENSDQLDHNKLRTYKTYKSSFTREPYLDLVRNRNQRSALTRLRTGSHVLGVERGRWTRPVTPLEQRTCSYCTQPSKRTDPSLPPWSTSPPLLPGLVDDEKYFL